MNLLDFYHQYPDEASCEESLRRFREHHGGLRLSWNPSHKSWACMDCKHEMLLRSGTKRAISTKEIQRQIGRKRYQPVWEMVHKLRDVMGKRDGGYPLHGDMEVDGGFFSTETPEEQKDCPLKRGRGSQRKTSVLVMAESCLPKTPPAKMYSTPKSVGRRSSTISRLPPLRARLSKTGMPM